MRRDTSAWLWLSVWVGLLAGVIATDAGAAAAQPQDAAAASPQTLQDVMVTAPRVQDHRVLDHAVNGFVTSHSAPGSRTNQIGRWHEYVCPLIMGLQPPARDFIARQIVDVARGVGAPSGAVGKKCPATVVIVFTRDPQVLLDRIARDSRVLLGFFPASQVKRVTTFSRPIQAWYETGTHSMDIVQLPKAGFSSTQENQHYGSGPAGGGPPLLRGAQLDSDTTATGMQPSGFAGSYLGSGVRSEFLHVLIIADTGQLAHYPLHSIADYLALLSLSRMAQLDQCAPLPSITDMLASGCAAPVADALTAADRAYLKALYSADLEKNLNLERGDIHEQMMRAIEGK